MEPPSEKKEQNLKKESLSDDPLSDCTFFIQKTILNYEESKTFVYAHCVCTGFSYYLGNLGDNIS